jgi:HEAT repeat protein
MTAVRVLGLTALLIGLAVLSSSPSAATAQIKLPPQIKPPSSPPQTGPTQPGGNPGTNPMTPGTGTTPGTPGTPGTGTTPGTPGLPGGAPGVAPKRDRNGYPKDINGKTVDDCVREMRMNSDPAIRESAVRTLPLYGPIGRDKGADHLIYALTKDPDFNVKMTALSVAPLVLVHYADAPDQYVSDGLTAFMNYLDSDERHVRYEGVLAVSAVGPYMKKEKPSVMSRLTTRSKEAGSWQMRRAAVAAMASIGTGSPPAPGATRGIDPDPTAVKALLDVLHKDNCALVRRAAIDALIVVGPVSASQQAEWHKSLEGVFKLGAEKEKINLLWVHALILRNDPNGLKGNEAHLNAVADGLKSDDKMMRYETCQAMNLLGEEGVSKLQGLLDLIQDPQQDPTVVAAAMMAAATMKSQMAIIQPVLQKAVLAHPNMDVRKVAGEALNALTKK